MARSNTTAPPSFRQFIRDRAAAKGLFTYAAIAEAAGIDPSGLSRWLNGVNGATVESLQKLASALDVRVGDMLVAAGQATPASLGQKAAPAAPPVPAEIRQYLEVLWNKNDEYEEFEIRGLLAAADFAFKQWERLVMDNRRKPREPRMRRR